MNTFTALTLASVITFASAGSAQANTLTDTLTETVSSQLAELSSNIRQQAKTALEKTAAELFFSTGTEQAQHNLAQAARVSDQTKTEKK